MLHRLLYLCQWPALITGWWGAWYVSGTSQRLRYWGFFLWILSDIFLCLYGLSDGGFGLVIMQGVYIITSLRGMLNNRKKKIS